MRKFRSLVRGAFDVRRGEYRRTLLMGLYFFLILSASTILKSVSWSLFLDRLSDRLPQLYMLMALAGGASAYVYSKVAVRASLRSAMTAATAATTLSLLVFWRLIDDAPAWVLYLFSVWVSLFGIIFVSQGWLIAATLFDSREAKRLYGLLGLGAILGGAAGGSFTAGAVGQSGTSGLLPAGALLVLLAGGSLHLAGRAQRPEGAGSARRARLSALDEARPDFALRDVAGAVLRHRHLLVIVGIIGFTYLAEVLVEYQFNIAAKRAYSGDDLTAFLGWFSGVAVSTITFVLQFFFTTLVVGRLGVGRTLMASPLLIGAGAAGGVLAPGLLSSAVTRLLEASTRYSVNRTAVELLYLPLPSELRKRTKAFIDVFVDRAGRFAAALLLLLVPVPRTLSLVILLLAALWILLTLRARREYVSTMRRRIEARRLDLAAERIAIQDTETVRMLEQVARGPNPRQVLYALSLLAESPGYDPGPLLAELAASPAESVRAKVYQLARQAAFPALTEAARGEFAPARKPPEELLREAVAYLLALSPDPAALAADLLGLEDVRMTRAVLDALSDGREMVQDLVTRDWVLTAAGSPDPAQRAVAAFAVGVRGDEGVDALHRLLGDPDGDVVAAACRAAGRVRNRDYLPEIIACLARPRLRAAAIEALAGYGEAVCTALGEILDDPRTPPAVRHQVPRVLAAIPAPASVTILSRTLDAPDPVLRDAALRALNRLREVSPELGPNETEVRRRILAESEAYFGSYAALARFQRTEPGGRATALLARTIEARLKTTIERLFHLLELRYQPRQMQAAYLAVSHRRTEEFATALDFLDNVLEHDLKTLLLPMIDGSPHLLEIGSERFGVAVPSLEQALRDQIHSGDGWLQACSIAAAAELKLRSLVPDITAAARNAAPEVAQVAQAASAALA